jgi:hypothetical protein
MQGNPSSYPQEEESCLILVRRVIFGKVVEIRGFVSIVTFSALGLIMLNFHALHRTSCSR